MSRLLCRASFILWLTNLFKSTSLPRSCNVSGDSFLEIHEPLQNDGTESPLGPVYTKCQHQCCNNSAMTLAMLFSLKTMESLENGLQPHSEATPLFSMRAVSPVSSQSFHSIDFEAWCKRARKVKWLQTLIWSPFHLFRVNRSEQARQFCTITYNPCMKISTIYLDLRLFK